jgi:hypothetical protein
MAKFSSRSQIPALILTFRLPIEFAELSHDALGMIINLIERTCLQIHPRPCEWPNVVDGTMMRLVCVTDPETGRKHVILVNARLATATWFMGWGTRGCNVEYRAGKMMMGTLGA